MSTETSRRGCKRVTKFKIPVGCVHEQVVDLFSSKKKKFLKKLRAKQVSAPLSKFRKKKMERRSSEVQARLPFRRRDVGSYSVHQHGIPLQAGSCVEHTTFDEQKPSMIRSSLFSPLKLAVQRTPARISSPTSKTSKKRVSHFIPLALSSLAASLIFGSYLDCPIVSTAPSILGHLVEAPLLLPLRAPASRTRTSAADRSTPRSCPVPASHPDAWQLAPVQ